MSFLNKLKGIAQNTQTAIEGEISRFKNKDALEALVGASVMIAYADGEVTANEKQKLLGFLQNSALTKAYSTDQVIKCFNEHSDRFAWDHDIGRSEALRIIGRQRANVDTARAIARLTIMIAESDGNFDAAERTQVEIIIRELGLNPSEFL